MIELGRQFGSAVRLDVRGSVTPSYLVLNEVEDTLCRDVCLAEVKRCGGTEGSCRQVGQDGVVRLLEVAGPFGGRTKSLYQVEVSLDDERGKRVASDGGGCDFAVGGFVGDDRSPSLFT
ncbi:hypothetical protein ACQPYV_21805 [Micromonospora saelicesensis]|uniref:hypothetical protein n=1 Tax=Micromonospora saelicesensis TaxID=285676 RepID=UPI003D8AA936